MSTAPSRLIYPLLQTLQERSLDMEKILAAAQIPVSAADNPDYRVTEQQLWQLWQQTLAISGDSALALKLGRQNQVNNLGILGHVISHAQTLGQALSLLNHFHRLLFDDNFISLHISKGRAELQIRKDERVDPEHSRPLVEYLLTSLLQLCGDLIGGLQRGLPFLIAVKFRHQRPGSRLMDAYRECYGPAQLLFEQKQAAICFDHSLLKQKITLADPALFKVFKQHAEERLKEKLQFDNIISQARASIRHRLLGNAPKISEVAADCNMSRASLQRRLQEQALSYQQLLDEERNLQAQQLLQDHSYSLDDIAFMLGYGDRSAFHHAFKRWNGQTPGSYRNNS